MMAAAPRESADPAHTHDETGNAEDVATDAQRDSGDVPVQNPHDVTSVEDTPERPWMLIAPAMVCIVATIIGAFGPWFKYERISDTNPDTWTTPGYQSGGLFIIFFATAALVTLGAAILRDRAEPMAWVAFIGMALCTVIVVSVWTDPPISTIPSGGTGTIGRLGWGPMVVGIAAPLGALFLFLTARRLTIR